MELIEHKYNIGDKIFVVRGLSCAPFEVQQIIYVIEKDKQQVQYQTLNKKSGKPLEALEDELYTDWEEVKAKMLESNKVQGEILHKQIDEMSNPWDIIAEQEKADETPKTDN